MSSRCSAGTSVRILLTLLAPKTLWTFANFLGSSDRKYGAKMQVGMHFRFRNLQAAQEELDRGSCWPFIVVFFWVCLVWWFWCLKGFYL